MSSENTSKSIRDFFIKKVQSNEKQFKLMQTAKIAIIAFILVIVILAIVQGFIAKFSAYNISIILSGIVIVALSYFVKFEKNIVMKDVFICPHCLKNILVKNIDTINCPFCDAEGLTFQDAINGCPHCGDIIRLIDCPYCEKEIDLFYPYDVEKLKEKRYERK